MPTFRELDGGGQIEDTFKSSLTMWYDAVRDKQISDFDMEDLCRAVRQDLFLIHVMPIALGKLEDDPEAGALFEFELASSIANASRLFWRSEPELGSEALRIFESQKYSYDVDTLRCVRTFSNWMTREIENNRLKNLLGEDI